MFERRKDQIQQLKETSVNCFHNNKLNPGWLISNLKIIKITKLEIYKFCRWHRQRRVVDKEWNGWCSIPAVEED